MFQGPSTEIGRLFEIGGHKYPNGFTHPIPVFGSLSSRIARAQENKNDISCQCCTCSCRLCRSLRPHGHPGLTQAGERLLLLYALQRNSSVHSSFFFVTSYHHPANRRGPAACITETSTSSAIALLVQKHYHHVPLINEMREWQSLIHSQVVSPN